MFFLSYSQERQIKNAVKSFFSDVWRSVKRMGFGNKKQLELFVRFYSFRKNLKSNEAIASCKSAYVENIGIQSREAKILIGIDNEMQKGGNFSNSQTIKDWFEADIRMMFTIVERQVSGVDLDARKLQRQKEKELEIQKESNKALRSGLLIFLGGLGLFLGSGVMVPIFAEALKVEVEAGMGLFAINLKNHLASNYNWLYYLISILLIKFIFKNLVLPNWTSQLRKSLDGLPLFSTYKALEAARFFTVFALLKESGYRTPHALDAMKIILPTYTKSFLNKMLYLIRQGEDISAILGSDLLNGNQRVRLKSILAAGVKENEDTVGKALSALSENMVDDTIEAVNMANRGLVFSMQIIGIVIGFLGVANIGDVLMVMMDEI